MDRYTAKTVNGDFFLHDTRGEFADANYSLVGYHLESVAYEAKLLSEEDRRGVMRDRYIWRYNNNQDIFEIVDRTNWEVVNTELCGFEGDGSRQITEDRTARMNAEYNITRVW